MIEFAAQTPGQQPMHTHCTHCHAEHTLDAAGLPPSGLHVQCQQCGHTFGVVPLAPAPAGQLVLQRRNGALYDVGSMETLQQWVSEGRVSREDWLSEQGAPFVRAADVGALAALFAMLPDLTSLAEPLQYSSIALLDETMFEGLVPPDSLTAGVLAPPAAPAGFALAVPPISASPGGLMDEPYHMPLAAYADARRPSYVPIVRQRRSRRPLSVLLLSLLLVCGGLAVQLWRPQLAATAWAFVGRIRTTNQAAREVNAGYRALQRDGAQDIEAALVRFTRASKLDAEFSDAWAGQAEAYLAQAEKFLETASELSGLPAQAAAANALRASALSPSEALRRQADVARTAAAVRIKQALALAPAGVSANRALAEYERQADPSLQRARPALAKARLWAGDDDARLQGIEAAGLALTQPQAAIVSLRALVAKAPLNNRLRYRLARLYAQRGERAGAVAQLQSIVQQAPQHAAAGRMLARLGESQATLPSAKTPAFGAASSAVAKAAQTPSERLAAVLLPPTLGPGAGYAELMVQAQALADRHLPQQAAPLYERAARKEPRSAAAFLGLGYCKLDQRDVAGAAASFETAVRNAPGLAAGYDGLAEAAILAGNRRDAEKHLRQSLATDPDGPQNRQVRQRLEELSK